MNSLTKTLFFIQLILNPSGLLAQNVTKFYSDTKHNQIAAIFSGTCTTPNSSTVCFSLQTGSWNDATIWSCGHVPTANDLVVIGPSNIITLSGTAITYTAKSVAYMTDSKLVFGGSTIKLMIKGG